MKIFKGNIVHTPSKSAFEIYENHYIVVTDDGYVEEIRKDIPEGYEGRIVDFQDKIIIPAYTDLHLHPFQYPLVGNGYDKELLSWAREYCGPAEMLSENETIAATTAMAVIHDLWKYGSLHSVHFPTLLGKNTEVLMDLFQQTGMYCYAGKSQDDLPLFGEFQEETLEESMEESVRLAKKYKDSERVKYIFTVGWSLDASDELLKKIREVALEYNAPFQSHLDENKTEIKWVMQRHPDCKNYSETYEKCGVFGKDIKTNMAHCIHTTEDEIDMLRDNGVYVAHCVHSNLDIMSGIMPLRRYLDEGIHVGIGSDISAGHTLNIIDCLRTTIQASKMLAVSKDIKPITIEEGFYIATKGGGEFFGKVGSFEKGYQFDALIIDDSALDLPVKRTIKQRMERYLYLGDDRQIAARYVRGEEIKEPFKTR